MLSNAAPSRDLAREKSVVEVRDSESYKGVFATQDIKSGSVIFSLQGTISTRPTKYTIQLSEDRHLASPNIRNENERLAYCWKYLNHSCEPNGYINTAELTFLALNDITAGEELTFNYLATESEMDVPFHCQCGSANCFGFIQGRNSLTEGETDRLASAIGKTR